MKVFLCGDLRGKKWKHVCKVGCCRGGWSETIHRLVELLLALFVYRAPPIPSLNKWTRLYPALAWWCVFSHLHRVLASVWDFVFGQAAAGHASREAQLDLLGPDDFEVYSKVNRVRATKVRNWLRRPKTSAELLVICICLRPILSLMGFLFKKERATAEHSITILLAPGPANPAEQVIRFFCSKVRDLSDEFWLVLRYPAWSTFTLQLALDTSMAIGGAIQWRVIESLRHYPWRLWLIVDSTLPLADRCAEVELLEAACEECLDPHFTKRVLEVYAPADLLDPTSRANRVVRSSIESVRATNIVSELRFGRISKQMVTSKFGRAASSSTLASKHVLSELSSMHGRAMDAWEAKQLPEEAMAGVRVSTQACTGWHLYLQELRGKKAGSMAEIAGKWNGLTDEGKEVYNERGRKLKEEVRMQAALDQACLEEHGNAENSTPLCMGNSEWPIRPAEIAHLCEGKTMSDMCKSWRQKCGRCVGAPRAPVEPQPIASPTCAELYGIDRCTAKLAADVRGRCDAFLKRLRRAAVALMKVPSLQLVCVCAEGDAPGAGAGHGGPWGPGGLALLATCTLAKDPQAEH